MSKWSTASLSRVTVRFTTSRKRSLPAMKLSISRQREQSGHPTRSLRRPRSSAGGRFNLLRSLCILPLSDQHPRNSMSARKAMIAAFIFAAAVPFFFAGPAAPQIVIRPRALEEMILAVADVQPARPDLAPELADTLKTFNQ